MHLYSCGNMIVKTILMDMEFVKTIDELMVQTVVNTSVAKKHIAEIERCIHTVKESSSDVLITPPFRYLHKLIVTDIVYFEVLWINFPPPPKMGFTPNIRLEQSWHTPT